MALSPHSPRDSVPLNSSVLSLTEKPMENKGAPDLLVATQNSAEKQKPKVNSQISGRCSNSPPLCDSSVLSLWVQRGAQRDWLTAPQPCCQVVPTGGSCSSDFTDLIQLHLFIAFISSKWTETQGGKQQPCRIFKDLLAYQWGLELGLNFWLSKKRSLPNPKHSLVLWFNLRSMNRQKWLCAARSSPWTGIFNAASKTKVKLLHLWFY